MNNAITVISGTKAALGKQKFTGMHIAIIAADSDREVANHLLGLFRGSGIECWTEQDMLPGSDRKIATATAYREADFILILLSKASAQTRGEYQRLIKMAMDANDFMPESGIKVIPVCLEPCTIPWELHDLCPVEASKPDATLRLVTSWAKEWQRRTEANDWPTINYKAYWRQQIPLSGPTKKWGFFMKKQKAKPGELCNLRPDQVERIAYLINKEGTIHVETDFSNLPSNYIGDSDYAAFKRRPDLYPNL